MDVDTRGEAKRETGSPPAAAAPPPRLVWDPAVRAFHWALVALVAFSVWSGKTGGFRVMENHMLSGYAILALVLFRLAWGIVGGRHARFREFVTSPRQAAAHARDILKGRARRYPGHNPLGAWSVLAMLASLAVQATTGLFASDDILTEGPLHSRVSAATGDWLTWLHYWNSNVLLMLIAIHLIAVAVHESAGERLALPMLHGRKRVPAEESGEEPAAVRGRPWLALALAAAAAGAVYALVQGI